MDEKLPEEQEPASEEKVDDDKHEVPEAAEPEVKDTEGETVATEEHDPAPVVEAQPEAPSEEHVIAESEPAEEQKGKDCFYFVTKD